MNNPLKAVFDLFRTRTIASDLAWRLGMIVSATLLLVGAFTYYLTTSRLKTDLQKQAHDSTERVAEALSVPMWNLDKTAIQKIGETFQQANQVAALKILDETGNVLFDAPSRQANLMTFGEDILYEGKRIGSVEISFSTASIREAQSRSLLSTFLMVLFGVLSIQFAVYSLLQQYVNQPLKALSSSIDTIARGEDYHALAPVPQADLNEIIEGVNSMARQITDRIEALQRNEEELISNRQNLEERVKERTLELEALNKELESFAYSISHDLRAPLRHIEGYSRALQDSYAEQLPGEARHFLDRIRSSIQRMSELVEGLLHFSQLSRQPLNLQRVEPKKMAELALEELAQERNGRLIDIRIGTLPVCQGDPVLLRQVYTNLLSNAIKYTRPCPKAVIEIGSYDENGSVVYFVRDNGVGFDMKYASKLFGVFQRLHSEKDFEGIGVGLAIIQRIIFRHEGKIWAESDPGKETSFYFTLKG